MTDVIKRLTKERQQLRREAKRWKLAEKGWRGKEGDYQAAICKDEMDRCVQFAADIEVAIEVMRRVVS